MQWWSPIQGSALQVRGADRRELTTAERETLLADAVAGLDRRLLVEAVVYQQATDTVNRNFVRFKPSILKRFAASFVGQPFLRDHAQDQLEARGGTIVASEFLGDKDAGEIRQQIELSAPWAIEAALRGLMDRFSIGWANTSDVVCSECNAPFHRSFFGSFPSCDHFPGDIVGEGKDAHPVEMIVMGAEALETSGVNTPAVSGTGVEAIRAALAAHRAAAGGADPEEAARRVREAITAAKKETRTMPTFLTKIGTILALSADADEETILAGVTRLRAEHDKKDALLSAELAAHAATKTELDGLRADALKRQKAETAVAVEQLITEVRGKVGAKIGADGKAERGGTPQEAYMLSAAERSLDEARAFVAALPQVVKRSLAALPPEKKPTAPPPAGGMTQVDAARAKKLGVDPKYYAQVRAQRAAPAALVAEDTDTDEEV